MSNTKKITKRENIEALLNLSQVKENANFVEFLTHELDLINNRKKSDKLSETQIVNNELKNKIVATMTPNTRYTITDIMKFEVIPEQYKVSQKISALVKQLIEAEKVVRTEEKGKAYFSLVVGG